MSFGLLSTGFAAKSLSDIQTELEELFRSSFGASINLDPESSVFGRLIGILSEREALSWDLAQAVYNASDPSAATGDALDAVCAITGTTREAARPSTVTLYAIGTNGTVLPSGRVASVTGSGGARFTTLAAATIITLASWTISTAYAVGNLVKNSGKVYLCTTAGTSAGAGGPTTTASAITDGSCVWQYLGSGSACVAVAAESEDTGPIVAVSGSITTIETPVSGWTSVTNALDADLGTDIETDAALRIRRLVELTASSNPSVNGIRSNVLEVEDVETCTVHENVTDTTDADGVPPHSIEVLVEGGTDADVAQAIFDSVAAGIGTYGTTTVTVADDSEVDHDIKFSRPTEVPIYVDLEIVKDPDTYPTDGDDQVTNAIVAYGDSLNVGKDARSASFYGAVFAINGVLDITYFYVGDTASPVTTSLTISNRERAVFDTVRVTLATTNGTP